jgi:carbon monoxide dehydrogenase subunit G
MELTGQQIIPASLERTWKALNDPQALKACINGCEAIEEAGPNEYAVTMAVKVGPVSARFKGRLRLSDIKPPTSYTIFFEGQGGIAGFAKGTASVQLTPEGTATLLGYRANAQVGGKLAQIGSRLIDASARKIADDFFMAFNTRLGAEQLKVVEVTDAELRPSGVDGVSRGWIRSLLDILNRAWFRLVQNKGG